MSEKRNTPPIQAEANVQMPAMKNPAAQTKNLVDSSIKEKKTTTAKKTTTTKSATAKTTAAKPATKSTAAKSTATKSTTAKTTASKTTAAKTATKSTTTKSTTAKKPATATKSATAKSATAKKSTATKSAAAKKPTAKKEPVKAVEAEEVKEVKEVEVIPAEVETTAETVTETVTEEVKTEVAVSKPILENAPEKEVVLEPAVESPAEATPVAVETVETPVAETSAMEEPVEEAKPIEEVKPVEEIKPAEESAKEGKTVEKTAEELEHEADLEEARREQEARDKKAEEDKLLPPDPEALLEVRHLKKYFVLKKSVTGKALQTLRAVDDVSFTLKAGQTLGIVGESGCGKTTMGRTILKLHQPSGGQIFFNQQDIAEYKPKQMRPLRTEMQIIFQDPYSSLPPRSTVGDILSEPVKVHKIVPKEQVKDYVLKIMEQCGLRDYYFERYPHEFSGGQRQRICIARALTFNPKLVVCDEPVSALDVSIQAQIINLLKKLQKTMGLTYVFISHDLSVVKHISDQIGVMYLGSMVEFGNKTDIFKNPLHPYTQALFSAVPNPNPDVKMKRIVLNGDIPSPANPPLGCKFHTRCPVAKEICKHVAPVYKEYEPGHFAACHCYPQE